MSELTRETLSQTNFTALDWGIVVGYLLMSVIIGVFAQRFAGNMTAYISAGRSVGTWLGVATMTGTELGLVTVMYAAEAGYNGGFAAFHIAVIAGVVTLVVGLTGFVVGPLRKEGVLTIPEYYEKRFGRRVRVLGGVVLASACILNMGLFLKLGAKFIVGVTGLPPDGVALPIVMTLLLGLVLFYTVLGGMVSVIITDYIQFVVLSVGLLVTTFMAIGKLGWNNIFNPVVPAAVTFNKEAWLNPIHQSSHFGPTYVAWMVVAGGLVGCAIWPTAVARALAMESVPAVRRQFQVSAISFVVRMLIPNFWGICAFVFIMTQAPDLFALFNPADGSDPQLSSMDAMPIFLGRLLPAGLIGLISAAMIAAFMSTHDSYLLCWSSVITQDVIAPLYGDRLKDRARIRITRWSIVLIGAFLWGWGLFYKGSDDLWSYMAITGAIYFTGAIPVLVGGLYWSKASSAGAFWSLVVGCSAVAGLEPIRELCVRGYLGLVGTPATEERVEHVLKTVFTSQLVGLICIGLTVAVFVIVSLRVPDKPTLPSEFKGSDS